MQPLFIKSFPPYKFDKYKLDGIGKMIMFVLWPFGGWLYSLRSANTRSSYVVFFLFSLLLCWHMMPTTYNERYDDFLGILERFNASRFTDEEIVRQIKSYFEFSIESPKELYQDILTWFSKSYFGDNYHFFFFLSSIPIALCQLGSMRYITNNPKYVAGSLIGFLVIALFIFPRDIITAQNPRFATGFWYCVFVTINYYLGKGGRNLYICLILFAPLFHAAFWAFVGFMLLVFLLGSTVKLKHLEKVAYVSIIFSFIDAQLLAGMSYEFLPPVLDNWVSKYMSDSSYDRFMSNANASGFWWVEEIVLFLLKMCYMLMMIQIIKAEKEKVYLRFYSFILCIFILINCIQFLPEMNTRYFNFTKVYLIIAWFLLAYKNRKDEWIIKLVALFSIWPLMFRYGYVLGGALSVNTPLDIFYMPLPYLVGKGLLW